MMNNLYFGVQPSANLTECNPATIDSPCTDADDCSLINNATCGVSNVCECQVEFLVSNNVSILKILCMCQFFLVMTFLPNNLECNVILSIWYFFCGMFCCQFLTPAGMLKKDCSFINSLAIGATSVWVPDIYQSQFSLFIRIWGTHN